MIEIKLNHVLNGRNTLFIFTILASIAVIVGLQLKSISKDFRQQVSSRAESLAYQVIALNNKAQPMRGPASVDGPSRDSFEIGVDPWGRGYVYKYLEVQGRQSLLLWSRGADGMTQIDSQNLHNGDDVAVLIAIEH